LTGELAALGAALIWSVSVTIFRIKASYAHPVGINIFNGLTSCACFLVTAFVAGIVFPADVSVWATLVLSGFIGISIGDSAFYGALPRIGVPLTSVIQCLAPPVTGLLAWFFLSERLSGLELTGILITTLGVAGYVYFEEPVEAAGPEVPRSRYVQGLWLAVIAALGQAGGSVVAKTALSSAEPTAAAFIRLAGHVLILAPITLMIPRYRGVVKSVTAKPKGALWIMLAGFLGSFLGLQLLATGIKHTSVAVALALSSTYPIWTMPIAYVLLGERFRPISVLCAVVAVSGVLLTVGW
jgi:drug/metabolite transporter (DMT)-like permease